MYIRASCAVNRFLEDYISWRSIFIYTTFVTHERCHGNVHRTAGCEMLFVNILFALIQQTLIF